MVGDENWINPTLAEANVDNAPVRVVHAPEVFEMTDKISGSVLRKAKNSMGVGIDLLKSGEADALVTAGNTGGVSNPPRRWPPPWKVRFSGC